MRVSYLWRRLLTPFVTILMMSAYVESSLQCNLCGNSTLPTDSLQREKNGITCRSLFDSLVDLQNGSDDCGKFQLTAFQTGCCDDSFLPEACSICPDDVPFRTATDVPSTEGRPELTCADLQGEASFFDFLVSPGDCSDTFLRRSAGWCGCEGHEIKCPLCPDGSRPPDPTKTENVLYGWDCAVFEYVMALLSEPECHLAAEMLEFDAAAFCCPHVSSPPDICSFCPEGQVVTNPEKIVSSEYGQLKCGDIDGSMQLIPTIESCEFTRKKFDTALCCDHGSQTSAGASGLNAGSSGFLNWRLADTALLVVAVLQALS